MKTGWEYTFNHLLKNFRLKRGVSQEELAEKAGFDNSYISRLESGARTPARSTVTDLSRALKLNLLQQDELLASAGFLPREVSSLLTDEPEVSEVLSLLQNDEFPDAVRECMRDWLRLLAEQARLTLRVTQQAT